MSLFGRTSCNEDRDWEVNVNTIDGETSITLTEQLNEKEAKDFLNKIEKEMEDKSTLLKVVKDRGQYSSRTYVFVKSNIAYFELERN